VLVKFDSILKSLRAKHVMQKCFVKLRINGGSVVGYRNILRTLLFCKCLEIKMF